MVDTMNVVDAISLARAAAGRAIPHFPMTAGAIEIGQNEAPVRLVTFKVAIIGSRKRYSVGIDVEVVDGRTYESVDSIANRLVEQAIATVGDRLR